MSAANKDGWQPTLAKVTVDGVSAPKSPPNQPRGPDVLSIQLQRASLQESHMAPWVGL